MQSRGQMVPHKLARWEFIFSLIRFPAALGCGWESSSKHSSIRSPSFLEGLPSRAIRRPLEDSTKCQRIRAGRFTLGVSIKARGVELIDCELLLLLLAPILDLVPLECSDTRPPTDCRSLGQTTGAPNDCKESDLTKRIEPVSQWMYHAGHNRTHSGDGIFSHSWRLLRPTERLTGVSCGSIVDVRLKMRTSVAWLAMPLGRSTKCSSRRCNCYQQ